MVVWDCGSGFATEGEDNVDLEVETGASGFGEKPRDIGLLIPRFCLLSNAVEFLGVVLGVSTLNPLRGLRRLPDREKNLYGDDLLLGCGTGWIGEGAPWARLPSGVRGP